VIDAGTNGPAPDSCDVAIVGAGAAGLATAIFLRRANPSLHVVLLDGAVRPGAKILVSGGGRCNVTNTVVAETDFWGGKRTVIRRILRALPIADTVDFFRELGVPLHEEAGESCSLDSNRARDVLDAPFAVWLTPASTDRGHPRAGDRRDRIRLRAGHLAGTDAGPRRGACDRRPIAAEERQRWRRLRARAFAGSHAGRPDSGACAAHPRSDTPYSIHHGLSGIAVDGDVSIWVDGAVAIRLSGALLWTHFGVSGPVVLNASRHWARAPRGAPCPALAQSASAREFRGRRCAMACRNARAPARIVRGTLAADLPDAVALAILRVLTSTPIACSRI
jgi:predicted flavoprotein YhiN